MNYEPSFTPSEQERLIKLMRKLRWIGCETEMCNLFTAGTPAPRDAKDQIGMARGDVGNNDMIVAS